MRSTGKFVALVANLLLLGALVAQPVMVAAQVVVIDPDNDAVPTTALAGAPANTVSCFDYYTFGSVQAKLSSSVGSTVSGTAITFSGQLVNGNPYPIVDGALYVKIFKTRGTTNDGNGPDVVDQFFVKGDIVIPAKSSAPISFQWRVPSYAQSGDYQLATFVTASRKFNLLGLSFTDDVVGNTVPFKVNGEQQGAVRFDKAGVTIENDAYHFASFPPREDGQKPVTLTAKVRNTTDAAQSATVSWVVYQWDAQLRENAVQEESKQVTVPADSSSDVTITVTDSKYPVYLVVGTLKWKDTQSVIGARFVREGVDRTRINFPGVISFPLNAGQENTLFSCLHNSGESPVVTGGKLELALTDASGNLIHQYTYSGDVTGAMMGVAEKFIPQKDYDYFVLDARLYQGDQFIDEAHLVYDCQTIDPSLCKPHVEPTFLDSITGSIRNIAVIVIGVIILIVVLWIYRRISRKPVNTTQLPPM
ncbi:hypothetical protein A2765_05515 [Candidatus Kaiserbacteria bacterium RIFCSPHIGHO2_01_FULL_56_24]|uniref:CARDB domain-containing protein n=1 Tax=Candidatus Kaiserbacteria bacterium RIFCSPHIGHO2_01_FULL_56_24 TaxID=1798487 RepID=A0A1F6DAA5_9BACT|nr:MAG: hypothetical protein A2765_05515 [Candidatus Kaiserbacteria bacterium RIFCSPHIGHO2_01_FULL_56_24]